MLQAFGALMPGPPGPTGGNHAPPPPVTPVTALATAAGDRVAATIELINNHAQLVQLFPYHGATDVDDATHWVALAKDITTAAVDFTMRWGSLAPWTVTDAATKGEWGLLARQYIVAAGYHDVQALALGTDGRPTKKVTWEVARDRLDAYCTKGKTYKWLTAPPLLPPKQAARPAWLVDKPGTREGEGETQNNIDSLTHEELREAYLALQEASESRKRAAAHTPNQGTFLRRPAPDRSISPHGQHLPGPTQGSYLGQPPPPLGPPPPPRGTYLELDPHGAFQELRRADKWEEAVAAWAGHSYRDLVMPQQFTLRCSVAQWTTLLARSHDDATGLTESLGLLAPHIAAAAKQTDKRLRGYMPTLVLKAFEMWCDGCSSVLRWSHDLEHSDPVVTGVKSLFATTARAWPQTALGGPALLAFAEQTRATLLSFLKTKAGTPAEMAFADRMTKAIEQDAAHSLLVVRAAEASSGNKNLKDKPKDAGDGAPSVPTVPKDDGNPRGDKKRGKRDPDGVAYSRDNPNKVDPCPHGTGDCGLHRKFLASKGTAPPCWVGTHNS